MQDEINLKNVKETQKRELNFAANYLLVIYCITMYDEIQLENPISNPT